MSFNTFGGFDKPGQVTVLPTRSASSEKRAQLEKKNHFAADLQSANVGLAIKMADKADVVAKYDLSPKLAKFFDVHMNLFMLEYVEFLEV